MRRRVLSFVVLAAVAAAHCKHPRRPPVHYGLERSSIVESQRAQSPWRNPRDPRLAAEMATARDAFDAGLFDPTVTRFTRCDAEYGWVDRNGLMLTLAGTLVRHSTHGDCHPEPSPLPTVTRLVRENSHPLANSLVRAVLFRMGFDEETLATAARSPEDTDTHGDSACGLVGRWATVAYTGAIEIYGNKGSPGERLDDRLASVALEYARFAIGRCEQTGISRPALERALPFVLDARELADNVWLYREVVRDRAGTVIPFSQSAGQRRRAWLRTDANTTAVSLRLSNYTNREGYPDVTFSGPLECGATREAPWRVYRASRAWFSDEAQASILLEWRAIEGLLQRLAYGRSFTRTLLPSCNGEPPRLLRAYELAYVLLAASLGYDALEPAEFPRFRAGQLSTLLAVEQRFRERLGRMARGNGALSRLALQQDELAVLWPRAAQTLASEHHLEDDNHTPPAELQRNRDAALVLRRAMTQTATWSALTRCEMVLAAVEIDRSRSESILSDARTVATPRPDAEPELVACTTRLLAAIAARTTPPAR